MPGKTLEGLQNYSWLNLIHNIISYHSKVPIRVFLVTSWLIAWGLFPFVQSLRYRKWNCFLLVQAGRSGWRELILVHKRCQNPLFKKYI